MTMVVSAVLFVVSLFVILLLLVGICGDRCNSF